MKVGFGANQHDRWRHSRQRGQNPRGLLRAAWLPGRILVLAPELALDRLSARDLVLNSAFISKNLEALERLAQKTGQTALVTGFIGRNETQPGRKATNAIALLQNGKVLATRTKTLLPTYDVFDEDRYFEPATENAAGGIRRSTKLGLTICEDVWNDEDFWDDRRYRRNPADRTGDWAG